MVKISFVTGEPLLLVTLTILSILQFQATNIECVAKSNRCEIQIPYIRYLCIKCKLDWKQRTVLMYIFLRSSMTHNRHIQGVSEHM